MALIGYPYVPSRDDLFLYQQVNVSWTGGSAQLNKPVAWNPSSPLYGYRRSLGGMSARYRTLSTTTTNPAWALAANDINNPANDPAFKNSWPPSWVMVNSKFMLMCKHCFGFPGGARDGTKSIVPDHYGSGSYFEQVMKGMFIDKDNNETVVQPSSVILPYETDPSFAALNLLLYAYDLVVGEIKTGSEIAVIPIQIADTRTMVPGSTAWIIDGSDKIIRGRYRLSWTGSVFDHHWIESTYPDGSLWSGNNPDTQEVTREFTHDSGAKVFVEISPPTSWAAGDGVLGMVPKHVFTPGTFNPGYQRSTRVVSSDPPRAAGYNIFSGAASTIQSGSFALSGIKEYIEYRGYTMQVSQAARTNAETASESDQSDLLGKINSIAQFIS